MAVQVLLHGGTWCCRQMAQLSPPQDASPSAMPSPGGPPAVTVVTPGTWCRGRGGAVQVVLGFPPWLAIAPYPVLIPRPSSPDVDPTGAPSQMLSTECHLRVTSAGTRPAAVGTRSGQRRRRLPQGRAGVVPSGDGAGEGTLTAAVTGVHTSNRRVPAGAGSGWCVR